VGKGVAGSNIATDRHKAAGVDIAGG